MNKWNLVEEENGRLRIEPYEPNEYAELGAIYTFGFESEKEAAKALLQNLKDDPDTWVPDRARTEYEAIAGE